MRIQRKSLVKEIQAHCPLNLNEPVGVVQPLCSKLYSKPLSDWKNVESFLKLRQMKCDKSIALLHCSKKCCRIDEPIPQVRCKNNTKLQCSYDGGKQISREMLVECQKSRKKNMEYIDSSLRRLYKVQDKSAEDYQNYLSKHIEDSLELNNKHSFNLKQMSRVQLFQKLKTMNKEAKSQNIIECDDQKNLTQKINQSINIQTTLRTSVEITQEQSPIRINEQKENKIMNKLKQLVTPQKTVFQTQQRQLTLPYFSKKQLNIKQNQLFVTNMENENNISSTNNSNINSLIRNKSSMFSREMKRLRIPTEC